MIEVRPLSPVVRGFYNTSIIAVISDARSCSRESDHSLVGMDVNAPPRLYLSPCYAFVVGAVKSHVASEDDTWIEGIHIEHSNPDTVDVRAAVSAGRAPR